MVKPVYAQVVLGPPGSGKTTYCASMAKLLEELGRKVAIVNIDPANENKTYKAAVDISELITLEDVMSNMKLGPNGALMYCLEFLEKNLDWFTNKVQQIQNQYCIFDCPGQVELYTHHDSMKNIIAHLQEIGFHICTVQLIDSHYCSDAGKFIATVLMSLSTMLKLETPHVNLLSKIDLAVKHQDKLQFSLDFYTEVLDLNYLLDMLDSDPITKKYTKLNAALVSLVEDYSLVSFIPMCNRDRESLLKVRAAVDKANGYVFGAGEERNIQALLACAVGAQYDSGATHVPENCTITEIFDENDDKTKKTSNNLSDELLWN